MVNWISIIWKISKRLIESSQGRISVGAFSAVIADDFVGMKIHDQREVFKVLPGPDIGNVGDPDLIGASRFKLRDEIPKHRKRVA